MFIQKSILVLARCTVRSTNSTEKMFKRNDRNVMVIFKPDEYMRKMIFQSVTQAFQSSLLWLSGRASGVATRAGLFKDNPGLVRNLNSDIKA